MVERGTEKPTKVPVHGRELGNILHHLQQIGGVL